VGNKPSNFLGTDKSSSFLLEKVLVDHLLELTTVKEMRSALQAYPTHLDQAFESSLERINSQSKSHSSLALRVIGWVVSAERKFLMSELIHGLGTEEGIDTISDENLLAPKTILKVCGGLVIANIQNGTVMMVHTTVYTWFRNREVGRAHEDLARSCLRYLTIRLLSTGPADSAKEMDERMNSLPFLSYAAQHWRKHVLDDVMETNLTLAINLLMDNANFRSAAFQASNYKNRLKDMAIRSASFESIPTGHSALHIAAYWNLPKKTFALLADGEYLTCVDSQGWTPLHWACFGKSRMVIPILVSHGAEIDSKDSVGWTPLFWTALNGDTAMLELLLANKANHLEQDIYGWTALRWGAATQQTEIVRILLKHHNNNLSRFQKSGKTTLKYLGVQEVLRYSVRKDIQSDILDELQDETIKTSEENSDFDLYSILHDASFDLSCLWHSGHFDPPLGNVWRTTNKAERINGVESYIGNGSHELGLPKTWRSRLLHAAIRDGKLLAVRLMIELGADVNGKSTRAPLHAAAFRKNPSFAEVLLQHGAHIEELDYQGLTPLQQAVLNGFEGTIKLLLSKGANVNAMCHDIEDRKIWRLSSGALRSGEGAASFKTPLMLACGLSTPIEDPDLPTRIVRLLIEYGADVNIKETGSEGMTAVHYAAHSRNLQILESIINAGADSRMLDKFGRTSIHHLVLGVEKTASTSNVVDSDGNCLPGMASDCLLLLSQKCETNFLSHIAEWKECYRISYSTWTMEMSTHTPLSLAILLQDWEVFQGLHRFGARLDTNIPLNSMLDGPFLALQPDAVDILIENGAKFPSGEAEWITEIYALSPSHEITSKEIKRLKVILMKLIPHGLDLNTMDFYGDTLLHKAVCRNDLCELTESLLEIGADPCQQNGNGSDSFILACLSNNYDALRRLFEHTKQNPLKKHWTQYLDHSETIDNSNILNAVCSAINIAGLINFTYKSGTLLCQAARTGNASFVHALLKFGADMNLGDGEGRRPLHFAAEKGLKSVVETLIHSVANVEVKDEKERTPLHISALYGHYEVVQLLLANGANPNVSDLDGWQPLHFAAWTGHTEAARCLIEAGLSVQAVTSRYTSEGDRRRPTGLYIRHRWTGTPLDLAAMAGSVEIVRLLLASKGGVNVNTRTDDFEQTVEYESWPPTPGGGPTALHITLDTGRFYGRRGSVLDRSRLEIASLLVENGASVEGVADHLIFEDIQRFEEFPQLWDKLRAGISDDD
jgi:ankyrin repeat protein